ncbi:MAG TPA: exodeoxyribonuclease V subunit beta [Polyangiaceae bacterium]|nr:exodeoxyribonuclease V subunit beta [Polyangiaceae bacterium]
MKTDMAPLYPLSVELAVARGGGTLVEASAGTGKTYTITSLFLRLLLERRLDPSEVGVVTFTEAATVELGERVRARVEDALHWLKRDPREAEPEDAFLKELLQRRIRERSSDLRHLERCRGDLDQTPISTIHGFCQRVLKQYAVGVRLGFDAELVPDLDELRDDILYDFWHTHVASRPLEFARQLDELGLTPKRLAELLRYVQQNPNVTLVPEARVVTEQALEEAFAAAELAYRSIDLPGFLGEYVYVSRISGLSSQRRDRLCRTLDRVFKERQVFAPQDSDALFPETLGEALKKKVPLPEFFFAFERFARLAFERGHELQHRLAHYARREFRIRKDRRSVLGFEDLLQRLHEALHSERGPLLAGSLRDRFKALLIDEFQDTDPIQFGIFETIYRDTGLPWFLIGDPKQSIYAFRGADVFTYLRASENARRFTLDTNFRSDPSMVRAVNIVFCAEDAFANPHISYRPVQARPGAADALSGPEPHDRAGLEFLWVEAAPGGKSEPRPLTLRRMAQIVASDIAALLARRATANSRELTELDIAVLTRTNDQCFIVQDALRNVGIHAVVIGDKSVFDSDEARELALVLGAALDPSNNYELRRALSTRLFGVSAEVIAELDTNDSGFYEYAEPFRRFHKLWTEHGFVRMFRPLFDEIQTRESLAYDAGGERCLVNLLHLGELLHRASVTQQLGPAALVRWFAQQRRDRPRGDESEIRLESDELAVRVLTVHKSKGLEFPVVYCPYLWCSNGPRDRPGPLPFHDEQGRAFLDLEVFASERRKQSQERAKHEQLAEELRVAYVALTRAKHKTCVLWGQFSDLKNATATRLFHAELLKRGADLAKTPAADLKTDLARLAKEANGAAWLREWLETPAGADERRDQLSSVPLSAREVQLAVRGWQRTESFTSLIRNNPQLRNDEEAAKDHDAHAPTVNGPQASPNESSADTSPGEPILLLEFPRGRRTGDFFHELLEHLDFRADLATFAPTISEQLAAFGLLAEVDQAQRHRLSERVLATLGSVLDTPLGGFCLRDISLADRLNELEFRLPVALEKEAGQARESVTRQRLARAFREHPSPELAQGYADRLAQGYLPGLRGYLKGYVDLVFRHGERWYLVDYKTTHMGDYVEDYGPAHLLQEMDRAHYYLQYHLYTLALDRYLSRYQPGYQYETHFGGVLYLFLKGMRPARGLSTGVFFEKPPVARLTALSSILTGDSV